VRLLEVLKDLNIEAHVAMSSAAKETLILETPRKVGEVESLAAVAYRVNDIAAPPSSGSFRTLGMVIVPCSMKTLAGVASGYSDNLILRAAEVTLKERRPLILVPRETPLTTINIENMLRVANAGAMVLPAMPGFYTRPRTIENLVDNLVGKILDALGIEHNLYPRWSGPKAQ
jgi:4-hydroxy-3-polyprenylbenzoate decarboxylase